MDALLENTLLGYCLICVEFCTKMQCPTILMVKWQKFGKFKMDLYANITNTNAIICCLSLRPIGVIHLFVCLIAARDLRHIHRILSSCLFVCPVLSVFFHFVVFTSFYSVFVFVLYYVLPEWRNKQLIKPVWCVTVIMYNQDIKDIDAFTSNNMKYKML